MENSNVSLTSKDGVVLQDNFNDHKDLPASPEQNSIKISSCSREQLLEMLAILEAELQARDVSIATFQNEKLRHMLYEAKYGRNCLDDPYLALERDGSVLGEDLDEDMLMRAAHETKLTHLENLLAAQHTLVEKIRSQVQLYQTKYSGVCSELTEERKKREQETSQNEKSNLSWGNDLKTLKEELAIERNCVKAYQEDMALMVSVVESMRVDIARHKQVALLLIKERKLLAECLLKDRQRLKELEEAALNEDKATIERVVEERVSKITRERVNLEERLKQEETKYKVSRSECDRLRQQLDYFQGQAQQQLQMQIAGQARQSSPLSLSNDIRSSVPPSTVISSLPMQRSVPSINDALLASRPASTNTPIANTTPTFTVTSRVPLDNAPTIAQRALAPPPYSYRSPSPAVSSTPSIVSASSSVQPFQNQININRSPAVATPVTPTSAVGSVGLGGPRLSFLPGQSAVLTTSSGQRISLHVSPSKPVTTTTTAAISPSPMVVHVTPSTPQQMAAAVPNRPGSASTSSVTPNSIPAVRPGTPQQLQQQQSSALTGNQRPVPPTPLSSSNNPTSPPTASSSFNITIRPDSKGVSTFVGASNPPEPPARLGMSAGGFPGRSQPHTVNSPSSGTLNTVPQSSGAAYQLDSPTESTRYLTIKKMGVAATHSINN